MEPKVRVLNKKWERRYQELKEYRKEKGDCLVPAQYKINRPLATWVETQRRQYVLWKSGEHSHLSQERIDKLEAIGFAWEVFDRRNSQAWNKHLEELKEYKQLKGDCNVPRGYPPNKTLAQWVADQRRFYRVFVKGQKRTPMTQDRIDKLEAIGFSWDKTQDRHKQIWDGMITELVKYRDKYGDCLVPFVFDENKHLGFWVSRQRTQYNEYYQKGIKSTLTKDKIDQLNGLGFSWVTPEEQTISAQYKKRSNNNNSKKAPPTSISGSGSSSVATAAAATITTTNRSSRFTTTTKRSRDTTGTLLEVDNSNNIHNEKSSSTVASRNKRQRG